MKDLTLKTVRTHALALVAHPDDETIWMGGTFIRFPEVDWTIFSLCRKTDPDRYPKFLKVCQAYGTKAIISDLEDDEILTINQSIPEIEKRINQLLKVKKFDYLFTHGADGEYGHPRHIGTHRAVKKLLKEKKLDCQQVFYFCYQGQNHGNNSHAPNNFTKTKYQLKLTPEELKQKRKIINELYGFTKKSFEYLSCLKTESFY